jgi:uncharacterized membrane protein YidH (DUF202 family)
MDSGPEPQAPKRYPEASRRTHFARERTLLAWWRTGVAVGAVALAVGSLIPRVTNIPKDRFLALGIGYGILALVFVIGGTVRDRIVQKAVAAGSFAELPTWVVTALTVYISLLMVLSVVAFL